MKHRKFRKQMLQLTALCMALSSVGALCDVQTIPVQAAEGDLYEGKSPLGKWGSASYYLLDDGTLYFGPGQAAGTKSLSLANYVTRIESSPDFDTSQVTSLNSMFYGFSKLEDISGLATWNTENVTNMYGMLQGTKITNVDALASWDTSSLTSLNSTFYNCRRLSDLSGLANWKTEKLSDMNGMFQNCEALTSLHGLENWNVTSLKSMSCTFQDSALEEISALSKWTTSSLSNTCQTFNGTKISDLSPLGNWDMSQNTGPAGMFSNISTLTSLKGLENWDMITAHAFGGIFDGSNNLCDVMALASWKVSPERWKNLAGMLTSPAIEKVDLSGWDLSNASVNNAAPNIFSFRPKAIRLSTQYLATKDDNRTALIDGNGTVDEYGSQYMSADLLHGPMSSAEILEGWQDDWSGWWGLAVHVTLDDGNGNEKSVSMPMLCDVTLPDDAFKRPGYVISGWVDENGNDCSEQYSVKKAAMQKVTAVWQRTDAAVTTIQFDGNGAQGSMSSSSAEAGGKLIVPENSYTWAKHEFSGWNTKADGTGESYQPGDEITAGQENAEMTLYARWTYLPSHSQIVFHANGAEGTMESLSLEEDQSADLPQGAFVRNKYRFDGWNTSADGTGADLAPGTTVTAGDEDRTIDLYAKWTYLPSHSQIVFHANGGEGVMDPLTLEEDKSAQLPVGTFVRQGYQFAGWNTSADGTGAALEAGTVVTAGDEDRTIDLYAQWEAALDYSQLQYAADYAKSLDLSQFQEKGKTEFTAELEKSQEILSRAKNQSEINTQADRLNKALLNLRRVVDKDQLDNFKEWSDDYL